jgi:hypothetical protein
LNCQSAYFLKRSVLSDRSQGTGAEEFRKQVLHQTNRRVRPNDPVADLSIYLVRVVLAVDHHSAMAQGNARTIEGTRSPLFSCENEPGRRLAAKLLNKVRRGELLSTRQAAGASAQGLMLDCRGHKMDLVPLKVSEGCHASYS